MKKSVKYIIVGLVVLAVRVGTLDCRPDHLLLRAYGVTAALAALFASRALPGFAAVSLVTATADLTILADLALGASFLCISTRFLILPRIYAHGTMDWFTFIHKA